MSVVDPDEVREVACDATASPELCDVREITEPVDPIDIAPPVGGAGIGLLGTILVVVLVVAIVAALAWLVKTWLDDRESDEDDRDDDLDDDLDGSVGERIIDHATPPDRWRRLAAEHRSAGRHRDSIRCEYRALVGDLARRGHVDEIPGRTSGEERDQIAELSPTVAVDFDVAADLFDRAWFDDAPVTEEQDRRFVAAASAVLGAVPA